MAYTGGHSSPLNLTADEGNQMSSSPKDQNSAVLRDRLLRIIESERSETEGVVLVLVLLQVRGISITSHIR